MKSSIAERRFKIVFSEALYSILKYYILMVYSEIVKVGKRGEIYTSSRIRKESGLKPDSYVRITVEKGFLLIRPIRRIEDLIGDYADSLTIEEAEELSIEAQKEAGIYE